MPQKYHNPPLDAVRPERRKSGLYKRLRKADWNWLPLVVAVCGWCTTLLLCRVMISRERLQVVQTATLAAHGIQSKVASTISAHVAPLEALVARWGADADAWQPEWESEALQLRQKYSAFESISWVDASYNVRWGEARQDDAAIRQTMDLARDTRKTTVSPAAGSHESTKTLLVLIPVFHRQTFEGWVIATVPTEPWLRAVVDAELPPGYVAAISDRNERIYVRAPKKEPKPVEYFSEANINFYGLPWVARVWPTPEEWAGSSKVLFGLTVVIGLLIYLSGALAVVARRKAREVERTKQKMVVQQEDLRQANERMEAIIQASPFAIMATDSENNVRSWNSAAERMFGWTREEAIGVPPRFVPAEQMDEFHERIERTAGDEPIMGLERRHRRKDETWIDVEVWTAPLRDAAGSVSGVITAIADVSEKKKLEEQLRHSQKMEAVGRLAGGVAHDFNNLLTIINGYGHMMLESLAPSDRLRSHAEQILKAGNQAAALTTQLLAFSRRQIIQPKPVDLNHVITNLEKMLRRVIGEDIVLHSTLDAGIERVKADPNQMEQVLINLAANARDAMPQGGVLTITTKNVILDGKLICEGADLPAGPYIELAVSDTGEGMDNEIRSHLFEPFFTTKARGKGTGLGLSSVYGSIRQNGGGISVWTERGQGTTFYVYLPQLRDAAPVDEPAPVHNGVHRGNETILLVEDEAPLRHMLRETLTNAGYRVLEASDGSDALNKWEERAASIDLLLTDVVMPLVNGRELARRLTSHAPRLQVIYMTGYADDVIAYHGILDEQTVLIQKPFLPDALLVKVREVLDQDKGGQLPPLEPIYQRARAS